MGLFKPDFYRFFTIGFAAGALLVGATMLDNFGSRVVNGVVPAAEAQTGE